jgi:hypothetical protein
MEFIINADEIDIDDHPITDADPKVKPSARVSKGTAQKPPLLSTKRETAVTGSSMGGQDSRLELRWELRNLHVL